MQGPLGFRRACWQGIKGILISTYIYVSKDKIGSTSSAWMQGSGVVGQHYVGAEFTIDLRPKHKCHQNHNYQPTGWVQGSGFVGQHPIGAVASLLPPLIIIHGPCCLLSRRTSRFDDQRGRLEKSRHPGLNILVSVRIPFKIEFLSWWSCHAQAEEKGNTFS